MEKRILTKSDEEASASALAKLLVHDVTVINATNGEILCELTLDPTEGLPTDQPTTTKKTYKNVGSAMPMS